MDELVRWLGEQLDEDEATARAATDGPWTPWRDSTVRGLGDLVHAVLTPGQGPGARAPIATSSWLDAEHIAAHDPARVLRDIEAKRDLLRLAERAHDYPETFMNGFASALEGTLRLFAAAYADQPGYLEEWRP